MPLSGHCDKGIEEHFVPFAKSLCAVRVVVIIEIPSQVCVQFIRLLLAFLMLFILKFK